MTKNIYDVAVIGNGSIGCSVAFNLITNQKKLKIALIGPENFKGSASLAAGAMLNIFGEIEHDSLNSKYGKAKLELLLKAKKMWPNFLQQINKYAKVEEKVNLKKGTIILNNSSADHLDDLNFNSIVDCLKDYKEKYEILDSNNSKKIIGYEPSERNRSLKSVYIPNEDFIDNPLKLLRNYYKIFNREKNIDIFKSYALKINKFKKLNLIKVSKDNILAKNIVICCGAYSQNFINQLNLKGIPKLFFGSGNAIVASYEKKIKQSQVIRTPNRGMACGLHTVPYGNNHLYIGATNRISDKPFEYPIISGVMVLMKSLTKEINENYSNLKIKKILVGHRPTTADTFPLIGPINNHEGMYIATGTKRDGLTLSPLIGKIITDLIVQKNQKILPKFFYPERKIIKTMTKEEGIKKSVMHALSAAYQHDLNFPDNNLKDQIIHNLHNEIRSIYKKKNINFGVPPEILNMYKYDKI